MPGDFLDSNVLLYVTSKDALKRNRAASLVQGGGCVSVQVLNEFASVSHRKFGATWPQITQAVARFASILMVRPVTLDDHRSGIQLAEKHRISFYDAVIAASALNAGCDRLWTEDLHHGLVLEGRLQIENPFLAL